MGVCLNAKLMRNLLIYNSLQGFFSFVFKFKPNPLYYNVMHNI